MASNFGQKVVRPNNVLQDLGEEDDVELLVKTQIHKVNELNVHAITLAFLNNAVVNINPQVVDAKR